MKLTYEQLLAVFEAAGGRGDDDPDAPWQSPTPLVDWAVAYGSGDDPAEWLARPLLPAQGAVAIFAKGGMGKSLLALWIAAGLATGTGIADGDDPVDVLYLDYEMTIRDVVARLEEMGHDDPAALDHLHYASLPTLAPLDTVEGGRAVVDMAAHLGASLVVIDTFGRAVDGEEDRADTVRAWFRWTGQLLKVAGIAFLRIDHAGKDVKRGQRGTSAKNDDVDVVWEMDNRGHGEYLLRATKRRVAWVEERVVLVQTTDNGVLAYRWDNDPNTFLSGTKDVAAELDELGAPLDISRRKAMAMLRRAGRGRGTDVVADALRFRREQLRTTLQDHSVPPSDGPSGPAMGTTTSPLEDHAGDHSGPVGEPPWPGGDRYVVPAPGQGLSGELEPDPGVFG